MKSCKTECGIPHTQSAPEGSAHKDPSHVSSVFIITEMACPTEEQLIRSKLATLPEMIAAEFNLLRRQLTVTRAQHAFDRSVQALQCIGLNPASHDEPQTATHPAKQ